MLEELPVLKVTERKFEAKPENAPKEDIREAVLQLEKEGEWEVIRVPEPYRLVKPNLEEIRKYLSKKHGTTKVVANVVISPAIQLLYSG